jgi:predicted AlkP superfamily pyrophosphatase or phosphodiesterase
VVIVSLDGLNPTAITRLGRRGTPVLHRLMRTGASTLNARSAYEMTVTLPNHTSMVTGRRIDAAKGGHGVTWNDDRTTPATVQDAAGGPVASLFTSAAEAGRTTALFTSKTKFSLWNRSWPFAINRSVTRLDNAALTRVARRDIVRTPHDVTFIHLSGTDVVGHAKGWMTRPYLAAVRRADGYLGRIVSGIRRGAGDLGTLLIVTADHGGTGKDHSDATRLANYRIPFIVTGPGVPEHANLYVFNPAYADPGRGRPTYDAARQPIRNGAVANLTLDALGLPAVPESQIDTKQDLDVFEQ